MTLKQKHNFKVPKSEALEDVRVATRNALYCVIGLWLELIGIGTNLIFLKWNFH